MKETEENGKHDQNVPESENTASNKRKPRFTLHCLLQKIHQNFLGFVRRAGGVSAQSRVSQKQGDKLNVNTEGKRLFSAVVIRQKFLFKG